ncbi:MAG TPA: glycosyltransferase family 4 protein [Terriglobales bacterium]|nr:glycosyltransferase family 4 protein [Terriglobales bacterium]
MLPHRLQASLTSDWWRVNRIFGKPNHHFAASRPNLGAGSMNIVFVNRYSFSYLGGVETHMLNLAQELKKSGHTVTLVCQDDRRKDSGWVPQSNDIRIVQVSGLLGLYNFLQREVGSTDVCHAHLARSTFSCCGVFFAWWFGIPTVFTPHCFYPGTSFRNRLLKWLYDRTITRLTFRLCCCVINLTPQDQRDSAERGMSLAKSRIIPNSISLVKLLNAAAVPCEKRYAVPRPYLLHVGRFHNTKCIDFLVKNLPALEGIGLLLIGQDDDSLPRVSQLVHALGLERRVCIIQRVDFQELCSAYRDALALVLASRYEGLPTVILEAAAFGIPTIAARVGGVPFIVEDGVNGYLYDWGDDKGYVECVHRAVSEGQHVGRVAKATLTERFCWEVNAKKIAAVYRELSEGPDVRKRQHCGSKAVDELC